MKPSNAALRGPKLPKTMREAIGDPANSKKGGRGRPGNNAAPLNRKDRRKAERLEKKNKKQLPARNGFRSARAEPESDDEEEEQEISEAEWSSPEPAPAPAKTKESKKDAADKPLKSILKRAPSEPETTAALSSKSKSAREASPSPPPQARVSRAVKDKLAEEEAEIRALEKKLGIKKKKGKKEKDEFDDGLEDLFGDFDVSDEEGEFGGASSSKRKRSGEDEDWLASKRRKALGAAAAAEESEEEDSDMDDMDALEELENLGSDEEMDSEMGSGEEGDFGGFDSEGDEEETGFDDEEDEDMSEGDFDDDEEEEAPQPRVRENPYVAPVSADAPQPTKYIPPALRAPPSSDAEALARLRRQTQGLINRLSDANMLTILKDIEQIYQSNPRGYVTTTLVDLLMGMLADETVLLDTFLITHSGFIAAIYKVIGPDFGAQFIERVVSDFDKYYEQNKNGVGKQSTNLVSVMAQLYMFQLLGANLVFDYIKFFLTELSEINTELLLRIVKVAGSQLRADDPTALKDIVLLLQKSVASVGEKNLPVRTKFMIETINNLKNNRMKTGVATSEVVSEHTNRMKKQLGSLNTRNLKGTEPIRIGLQDIKNTEKKGKWWLVGASWRNDTTAAFADAHHTSTTANGKPATVTESHDIHEEADGEVDLLQLAREQRMNTDIRRAIFVTIMSAADFKDAHTRLLKLNLKKSQEAEIPRVIVHCAGCEATYNPYYTLLARKFCADHKSRKGFQFALWDVFKSLGVKRDEDSEGDDSEDDDDEEGGAGGEKDLSLRKLVNLGKLYGTLIAQNALHVTVLKPLSFQYLKAKTKSFIEIMLVTIILESQKASNATKGKKAKQEAGREEARNEKQLLEIFINADAAPEMIAGLQWFLKKTVRKTELVASKSEKETVQWACKAVDGMLTRLLATVAVEED